MPDSTTLDTSHPASSSLDIPGGGTQLLDATNSALNTAPRQDVEPTNLQSDNIPADGATEIPLSGDGPPAEGAPTDGGPDGGENAQTKKKKSEPRIVVLFTSDELDEIVKQGFSIVEKECEKEEYKNGRVEHWKAMLEDYLVKCANNLDKPFKYTFYVAVHQNSGDGVHMALGGFFQADLDGYTTAHWESDDLLIDVAVMAFSVQ